jgi:hypothetical protein
MKEFTPAYSPWRHGGWYVHNVQYPSGAIGCVSRNYPDKKWRIVCDDRRGDLGDEGDFTFPNRDAAARAEFEIAHAQCVTAAQAAGWTEAGAAYAGKVVRVAFADETPDFHFAGEDCILADDWESACLHDRNYHYLKKYKAKTA